jgi:GAF domain-containing protein
MPASEIERLQLELARERAARAQSDERRRIVELELRAAREELRRNIFAFQEMALRHQQALVRLAGLSPDEGGLAAVHRELTKVAAETIGVERTSVWHLTADATELSCELLYQRGPDSYSSGQVLRATDYPRYFEALKLGRAIDGHDARRDPRTNEFTAGYLEPLGITSMLDAAIRSEGDVIGVVCLEHIGQRRTWTAAEMEFAGALADQAALALAVMERHRLEEERAKLVAELGSAPGNGAPRAADAIPRIMESPSAALPQNPPQ